MQRHREASLYAETFPPLFFQHVYRQISTVMAPWMLSNLGVRCSSEYSSTQQRGATQCNATSVGNHPIETIIDVARNAFTLRPIFTPKEIRSRLCKILQRRPQTITVPTCPEFQRMLEKDWHPLSQLEGDNKTAMKSRLATPPISKHVR